MTIQMIEIKIGGNSIIEPNELPKLINKIAQLFSADRKSYRGIPEIHEVL